MKLSTLLLLAAMLSSHFAAYGQVKVNYNSSQKIGANGFFTQQ